MGVCAQLCTCGCGACVEMSISAGSACVGVSFKFGWYTICQILAWFVLFLICVFAEETFM